MPSLPSRQTTYFQLSTAIAHFNNDQLKTLLQGADASHGWGVNHTITVGKSKVFVKTVPFTNLEFANPFTTK
jgi:hypothetical protein